MLSLTVYSAGDVLSTTVQFTDGEGEKQRPILVVSTESYNRRMDHVIFCPITTTKVPFATYHAMDYAQGSLPVPSNVVVDTVFTVKQAKISKKLGRASERLMAKVLRDVHDNIASPARAPLGPGKKT